jgi:hypothetical protein
MRNEALRLVEIGNWLTAEVLPRAVRRA